MIVPLILLSFIHGIQSSFLPPPVDLCSIPQEATIQLDQEMSLPKSYKISGSVTDWITGRMWMIDESKMENEQKVLKRKMEDFEETWIQEKDHIKYFNSSTDMDCDGNSSKPRIIESSFFLDSSSLEDIVNGVFKRRGFEIQNHSEVVGGVNTRTWISCIEGGDEKPNYLLEVRYSPSRIVSIRIAEISSWNDSKAYNHWSIEMDRIEDPNGDEGKVPSGIYCKDIHARELILKSLNEYAGVLTYRNHFEGKDEIVEILYSKSRQIFILSGESMEKLINIRYTPDIDYIVHDFKYGYEFTMSQGACADFFPLPVKGYDVLQTDQFLLQKPLEYTIIPVYLKWVIYEEDAEYVDLRSMDYMNDWMWELRLTRNHEIHSFKIYKQETGRLFVSMQMKRIPMEKSRLLMMDPVKFGSCYDDGSEGNNTWVVPIQDRTIIDVNQVGLHRLNEAVTESISKLIHPIIPYRIIVFYTENEENELSLIIRLAEKTEQEPAAVPDYKYNQEISTQELLSKINEVWKAGNMKFEFKDVFGDTQIWIPKLPKTPTVTRTVVPLTPEVFCLIICFSILIGFSSGGVLIYCITRKQQKKTNPFPYLVLPSKY